MTAASALGVTFVVSSTGDEPDTSDDDDVCLTERGECTLRAAIEQSNATPTPDTIEFDIPGAGPHRIAVRFLPVVTDFVVIDGYSQPGSRPNTLAVGDDAVISIEVDASLQSHTGTSADATLILDAAGCRVRGLSLFGQPVGLDLRRHGNVIQGNFVGVDAAGQGLDGGGLLVWQGSVRNQIGGRFPSDRNVLAHLSLIGPSELDAVNFVQGNYIGTDPTGTTALNTESATAFFPGVVHIQLSHANLIGGPRPGEGNLIVGGTFQGIHVEVGDRNQIIANTIGLGAHGEPLGQNLNGIYLTQNADGSFIAGNVIAHSGRAGILVSELSVPAIDNDFFANRIYASGGLAIDFTRTACRVPFPGSRQACPDGVTPNDADDADEGPNHQQNFPEIGPASFDGRFWLVPIALDAAPGEGLYRIELFGNRECDASGHGEAETFLGQTFVTTDAAGDASVVVEVSGSVAGATYVSATATDPAGNTSELSACRRLNDPPVLVCENIPVPAGPSCTADASVVVSASDPNGDAFSVVEAPPSPYPLGDTSVDVTATDALGASATCTARVRVLDLTAPEITCPADLTLPAVGASGAPATYAATATDNCGVDTVRCSPSSGDLFAIGVTPVACSARDAEGNVDFCRFTVHILGAAEQLALLRDHVQSLELVPGIDNSLVRRLDAALAAIDLSDTARACTQLETFIREVSALAGKQIPAADAMRLIDAATRIRQLLGC